MAKRYKGPTASLSTRPNVLLKAPKVKGNDKWLSAGLKAIGAGPVSVPITEPQSAPVAAALQNSLRELNSAPGGQVIEVAAPLSGPPFNWLPVILVCAAGVAFYLLRRK